MVRVHNFRDNMTAGSRCYSWKLRAKNSNLKLKTESKVNWEWHVAFETSKLVPRDTLGSARQHLNV